MARFLLRLGPVFFLLVACAAPALPEPPLAGKFDFSWRLRGDRSVGPLQVFDNGQAIWLQFSAQQAVPAVFAYVKGGEQALSLEPRGQFYRIQGQWQHLLFRGALATAQAYKSGQEALENSYFSGIAQAALSQAIEPDAASADTAPTGQPSVLSRLAQTTEADAFVVAPADPITPLYAVQAADQTLRQALIRWAQLAGWVFEPEHWSVAIDYPISAAASFSADFVGSVQALLATTDMSEQPLQACFYSNRVLRVVNLAQACNHKNDDQGQAS